MAKQEDQLEAIGGRVEALLRLTALRMVEGMKTGDAIRLLGRAGLERNLIAELCDTTPGTVNVRLAEAKRGKPSNGSGKRTGNDGD